ncbi:MAG: cytochrome C [Betaproteobacteria bacterium]|nr:cytochrome C [Betaproteobacteria bacterium]MDH5350933.1 cytochrome C [Betaproteobacteria bacterium]
MTVRCLLAAWLALAGGAALGQSLESVLSPGPLAEAHARAEGECRNCHVPFDRAAQNALCLDCHKEVGVDLREHRGYHGRIAPQPCRACHTDHRGRGAKIVQLDERAFDHGKTDFALRGAHAEPKLECRACHPPKKKYREAPGRCVDCHAKQDVHKGRLGAQCADCHAESDWKKTRFDHGKTRFPLRGKHAPVKCASCHKSSNFKEAPVTCIGCHRADDKHKARYGQKCETCHSDQGWKLLAFDHDKDTHFALRGRHRAVQCDSCHTGDLYRDKLQATCIACHRKDDRHKGSLGTACGDCHSERDWKVGRFDHAKTRFPLLGRHAAVKCDSCHKSAVFKDVPGTCIGCHRKDDRHKGALGENCASCHGERSWKESRFDHAKTAFPLLGSHARVRCESCHRDTNYRRTPKDCFGCHRQDDVHEGQLGTRCDACHDAGTWKKARFDHGRTRFPLLGGHLVVPCAKCHAGKRYKDAKPACVSCHARDDVHKRRLGPACETCHNARAWRSWDFDHARRARFALDGAHARLKCEGCHRAPVDGAPRLAASCASCHAGDDVHDGGFGRQCEKCHVTSSFKTIRRRVGMAGGLQ